MNAHAEDKDFGHMSCSVLPRPFSEGGTRNFFLHFDSVITINRRNLAPPTLPDVLVTGC